MLNIYDTYILERDIKGDNKHWKHNRANTEQIQEKLLDADDLGRVKDLKVKYQGNIKVRKFHNVVFNFNAIANNKVRSSSPHRYPVIYQEIPDFMSRIRIVNERPFF